MTISLRRLPVVVLIGVLLALFLAPPQEAAAAATTRANPRVLMIGDSLTWQSCGAAQRIGAPAPRWLREREGGCYGFWGASTPDTAFMLQGGRFHSRDAAQPHPYLPGRGLTNPYDLREAIAKSRVVVFGLGTNDASRLVSCGSRKTTYWPVQIDNARGSGPNPPPCAVSLQQFSQHIDYFLWLAQGKQVLWIDVAATNPAHSAHRYQRQINAEIQAAAKRHPNLHVIPWSRAVAANPGYVAWDGVHLTDAGRAARLQLVADHVWGLGYR
ncbi:GDSL-type esterase/lipase family protein [Geodermatophilus sp. SYSU D00703]